MSTTIPPIGAPTETPLTPGEAASLALADAALHDADRAVIAVAIAKAQADALKDAALSAAIAINVADAIAAAKTTSDEKEAAYSAADIPDPREVRVHAELARAAADRAVAAEDQAVIRVEFESLAIASIERDFTRITGLTLGDIRPIRHRSHPYDTIPRDPSD
jgi:hypothetical protein